MLGQPLSPGAAVTELRHTRRLDEARYGIAAKAMTSTRFSGWERAPFLTIVRAGEALPKYCFRRSAYLASWSGSATKVRVSMMSEESRFSLIAAR
jgi:hypothetical protein